MLTYIERAFARGETLWRTREETLKKRLAFPLSDARESGASAGKETARLPVQRMQEKLAGTRDKGGEDGTKTGAEPVGMTAARTGGWQRPETLREETGAAWLARELAKSAAAEENAAAARETDGLMRPAAQRAGAAESLSLSLERDARRYDGGFLYY